MPEETGRRSPSVWRMTISRQLVILVLVVAVPILGAVVYAARVGRSNEGAAAERASAQMAALAVSGLDAFIVDLEAEMRVIAERPLVRLPDKSQCDPILGVMQEVQRHIGDVALVDLDGQVICSEAAAPLEELPNIADTAWFQEAKRTGRFVVSEPHIGRITGRRAVSLVLAVEDGGARTGYLRVSVDQVRLQATLDGLADVSDGLVTVISESGQIVARSADSARYAGTYVGDEGLARLHKSGGVETGVDGVRRIYANSPMAATSWIVSAGIPAEVAFRGSDRLESRLLAMSVALVALALLAAALVGRRIARPIRALASGAEGAAADEPHVDLPLEGPRETVVAAQWFNEMVASSSAADEERQRLVEQMGRTRDAEAKRRLELLERLAVAEDAERERIAHDVHDETIQQLAAAGLRAEGLARGLAGGRVSPEQAVERLAEITTVLQAATESVRDVVFNLVPPDITSGLLEAVRTLADRLFEDTDTVAVVVGDNLDLDLRSTNLVYRIVAEAVRNAREHAHATAVEVTFQRTDTGASVTVTDNGIGVPPSGLEQTPGHLGARLMTERAQVLGGTCTVTPRSEGGTSVELRFE